MRPHSGVATIAATATSENRLAVSPSTRACSPRQTASTISSISGFVAPIAKCIAAYSTIAPRIGALASIPARSVRNSRSSARTSTFAAAPRSSRCSTASHATSSALANEPTAVTRNTDPTPACASNTAPSTGPAIVPTVLAVWIQPVTVPCRSAGATTLTSVRLGAM